MTSWPSPLAVAISEANARSFFFSLVVGTAGQMIKSEEADVEVELPRKYSPPRRLIKFTANSFSSIDKPSNKLNFTFAKGYCCDCFEERSLDSFREL